MDERSTSLAANLNFLRATPAQLLVLGCLLYLRGKPGTYVNYMSCGFAIFEAWCKQHPGWARKQELLQQPKTIPFNVSQLVPGYEINRIAMFLDLPNNVIESAMCVAIRMIACPKK